MKIFLIIVSLVLCGCRSAIPPGQEFEWSAYGGDPGGSRYASHPRINRSNVDRLKPAWTYHTGESERDSAMWRKAAFEATPIFADGTLFFSTPFNRVIALDARSGTETWRFDPRVDLSQGYSEVTSRGVATWLDESSAAGAPCRRRIYLGTIDARLIALDAASGRVCGDFGNGGTVDLSRGVERYRPGDYGVTSPPVVVDGLVIVGSSIGDNGAVELERGVVRAFDARTGNLRWTWDPIPAVLSESPAGAWTEEGRARTGAANAWAPISVDPQRGLIFVPTSSPSPDYYGGERLGTNEWANSVVALRARDGHRVWHFQVVHHDLWDYDVAAQPLLFTLRKNGESIPAVVVGTKMGNVFVLHRETGEPLFGVEERPAPSSDVPGEEASPTQPHPTELPPLGPQRLSAAEAWGLKTEDREWCADEINKSRNEGMFTPPSVKGTLVFPGNVGGIHWGGMAIDPERQLIIAPTNRLPFLVRLIPRERFADERRAAGDRIGGEFAPQRGAPFGMFRQPLLSPGGTPCNPPPWGALTALDLSGRRIAWEVPIGRWPGLAGGAEFGSANLGGPLVTAGGLVFIAAGMDETFRAVDIETGKQLWRAILPASAQATPMSYLIGGKQYIVIAAGGHGKLGTKQGDSVVAFTLPD